MTHCPRQKLRLWLVAFFSFLFIVSIAVAVILSLHPRQSDLTEAIEQATVSACLCYSSTTRRDAAHVLGVAKHNFYSCVSGHKASLIKRSPLSVCFSPNDPDHFRIHEITKLSLTHAASGSVLQVVHASSITSTGTEVHVSKNHNLMVAQIQQLDDAWFDLFSESLVDICGEVLIRPVVVKDVRKTWDSSMHSTKEIHLTTQTISASSPLSSTEAVIPTYHLGSHDIDTRTLVSRPTKNFDFCACDKNSFCIIDDNQAPVKMTGLDPFIRVCMIAYPNKATLNLTFGQIYAEELLLPLPLSLEIQYNEGYANMAVATAQLLPDLFDESRLPNITVAGKVDIFVEGDRTKGEVAFLVRYYLSTFTESPSYAPTTTSSPSVEPPLGAVACVCDKDSKSCLKDVPFLSFASRDVWLCVL